MSWLMDWKEAGAWGFMDFRAKYVETAERVGIRIFMSDGGQVIMGEGGVEIFVNGKVFREIFGLYQNL